MVPAPTAGALLVSQCFPESRPTEPFAVGVGTAIYTYSCILRRGCHYNIESGLSYGGRPVHASQLTSSVCVSRLQVHHQGDPEDVATRW
jgi:hypothetical protein